MVGEWVYYQEGINGTVHRVNGAGQDKRLDFVDIPEDYWDSLDWVISPDGTQIVWKRSFFEPGVSDFTLTSELYVATIATSEMRLLTRDVVHEHRTLTPWDFSPDGSRVFVYQQPYGIGVMFPIYGTFGVLDVATGQLMPLPDPIPPAQCGSAALSDDGARLARLSVPAEGERIQISLTDLANGRTTEIDAAIPTDLELWQVGDAVFSPDGRELVYTAAYGYWGSEGFALFHVDLTTGTQRDLLARQPTRYSVARFESDGSLLLTTAWASEGTGTFRLHPDGTLEHLSELTFIGVSAPKPPSPTPEPQASSAVLPAPVIYLLDASDEPVAPGHHDIWRLEVDGTTATQIVAEPASVGGFAVSPLDGSIAYTTRGDNDLYRTDAGGNERTLLVDGRGLHDSTGDRAADSLTAPAWSPDGKQIAYGLGGVNIISAEGGEPQLILASEPEPEGSLEWSHYLYPMSWSPDGMSILIGDAVGGGLAIIDVADGSVTDVHNPSGDYFCCSPTWSTDGQDIYFSGVLYDPSIFQAPGLWRVDGSTGQAEALIPGYDDPGAAQESGMPMTLIQSVQQLSDDNLYAFAAFGTFEELWADAAGNQVFPQLEMTRFASDGSRPVALRSDASQFGGVPWTFGGALWAPDASGAVVSIFGGGDLPNTTLLWLPSDGSAPVVLSARGQRYEWGK